MVVVSKDSLGKTWMSEYGNDCKILEVVVAIVRESFDLLKTRLNQINGFTVKEIEGNGIYGEVS